MTFIKFHYRITSIEPEGVCNVSLAYNYPRVKVVEISKRMPLVKIQLCTVKAFRLFIVQPVQQALWCLHTWTNRCLRAGDVEKERTLNGDFLNFY